MKVPRQFGLVPLLAFLSLCLTISCQSESPSATEQPGSNSASPASSENSANPKAAKPKEVFTGPSCQELNIPSWDRRIKKLSDELCVRCHNDRFAWNGARLDTYDEFVKNSEGSIERIRTGNLSFPLNVLEANAFIDWYEAGMPKSEEDCAKASSDS